MIVETREGEVLVKFPLSSPQKRWNIIGPSREKKVKPGRFYGLELLQDDLLEVMINWDELRDILSAFCHVKPREFKRIKNYVSDVVPQTDKPEDAPETERVIGRIEVKRLSGHKQRKPEERWIGIFICLPFFDCENTHLMDKDGASKSLPTRIQSGDVLVWRPDEAVMMVVVEIFASTSPDYKLDIENKVFGNIKRINSCG
ncbi:MAG: hypothetical protein ABIN66_04115 [candidate division WOR-3 bacterium]